MMAPGELDGAQVTVFSAAHPSSSRKRPYIERALQVSTDQGKLLYLFSYCFVWMQNFYTSLILAFSLSMC